MTPTEKRYRKRLGKLYWSSERHWDSDKQKYTKYYNLVMLTGIVRRNANSGKYFYSVDLLSGRDSKYPTYRVECAYFAELEGRINKYSNGYFPVITGEAEKDAEKIPKAEGQL